MERYIQIDDEYIIVDLRFTGLFEKIKLIFSDVSLITNLFQNAYNLNPPYKYLNSKLNYIIFLDKDFKYLNNGKIYIIELHDIHKINNTFQYEVRFFFNLNIPNKIDWAGYGKIYYHFPIYIKSKTIDIYTHLISLYQKDIKKILEYDE